MDTLSLIIALVSGAIGGNIAGATLPEKNLGGIANTIVGLIGGGASDFILRALGVLASTTATGHLGEMDIGSILATVGASGVSGGGLTAIVTLIKNALQNK